MKGFKQFLMRGNVVDLAVAVIVGTAFTAVVQALVKDFLTPLIAAVGGQPDFSELYFQINGSKFLYGHFVNAVISFLMVAVVVYLVVVLPLNKVNERRKRGVVEDVPPTETELLAEIRDLLRDRQRV